MRLLIVAALAYSLLIASGCAQKQLPVEDLRSGVTLAAIKARIVKQPDAEASFKLGPNAEFSFTVLEYHLSPRRGSPEIQYWMLFDGNGLVSYGRGGSREAKARAFDTYYTWMARQEHMKHGEAERKFHSKLRGLYKSELNPRVTAYMNRRSAIMEKVDSGEIPQSKALSLISKALSDVVGERKVSPRLALQLTAQGRYATLRFLGMDIKNSNLIARPRAGGALPAIFCSRSTRKVGSAGRCQ